MGPCCFLWGDVGCFLQFIFSSHCASKVNLFFNVSIYFILLILPIGVFFIFIICFFIVFVRILLSFQQGCAMLHIIFHNIIIRRKLKCAPLSLLFFSFFLFPSCTGSPNSHFMLLKCISYFILF